MRLFVAVDLNAAVIGAAMDVMEELKGRVRRQAPGARVTWAAADRMHLTLAFIGSAGPEQAAAVEAALRVPLKGAPFDIELGGVGVFPERGAPRVLWVGVQGGRDRLVELAADVANRLASAAVPREGRPYQPHLTLGRVREAARLRGGRLLEGLAGARLGTSRVEAITLFESRLSPKGSMYRVLQRTAIECR